jgi:hypothetical protein
MGKVDLSQRVRYRLWSLPRSFGEFDAALLNAGTYRRIGWFTTLRRGAPVDYVGGELPSFTYAATYWLGGALRGYERVFEYGAGHSTLWFSRHVGDVTSVERDEHYVSRLKLRLPANVRVHYRVCAGDESWAGRDDPYVAAIRDAAEVYDVVVADGFARNSCVIAAMESLKPTGLIVLNNADHPIYRSAVDRLASAGFQRLDLIGPAPGVTNFSCTSIFCINFSSWLTGAPDPPFLGVDMIENGISHPCAARALWPHHPRSVSTIILRLLRNIRHQGRNYTNQQNFESSIRS